MKNKKSNQVASQATKISKLSLAYTLKIISLNIIVFVELKYKSHQISKELYYYFGKLYKQRGFNLEAF